MFNDTGNGWGACPNTVQSDEVLNFRNMDEARLWLEKRKIYRERGVLRKIRMRDPERIDRILQLLKTYWKANPDLRLAQIITNMSGADNCPAVFYFEDDKLEIVLKGMKS